MNQMSPQVSSQTQASGRMSANFTETMKAPLGFTVPTGEDRLILHSAALTGDQPKMFFEVRDQTVDVHDMRPIAAALDVDREGFELVNDPTDVDDLYDDAAVETAYYEEITALLTQRFGASHVAIFDHTRRSDGGQGAANQDGARGPAGRLHVDYTAVSGPNRARDVLGDAEVDRILSSGGRILQVNVWRPISGPVKRAPLALADAGTIADEDLLVTDQIFPDRVGEIYHVAHNPDQRWYWAPDMERDEVLLIKGWDSVDKKVKFTPHGAFQIPDQDPGAPPRESIEVRTYVVIEA